MRQESLRLEDNIWFRMVVIGLYAYLFIVLIFLYFAIGKKEDLALKSVQCVNEAMLKMLTIVTFKP